MDIMGIVHLEELVTAVILTTYSLCCTIHHLTDAFFRLKTHKKAGREEEHRK